MSSAAAARGRRGTRHAARDPSARGTAPRGQTRCRPGRRVPRRVPPARYAPPRDHTKGSPGGPCQRYVRPGPVRSADLDVACGAYRGHGSSTLPRRCSSRPAGLVLSRPWPAEAVWKTPLRRYPSRRDLAHARHGRPRVSRRRGGAGDGAYRRRVPTLAGPRSIESSVRRGPSSLTRPSVASPCSMHRRFASAGSSSVSASRATRRCAPPTTSPSSPTPPRTASSPSRSRRGGSPRASLFPGRRATSPSAPTGTCSGRRSARGPSASRSSTSRRRPRLERTIAPPFAAHDVVFAPDGEHGGSLPAPDGGSPSTSAAGGDRWPYSGRSARRSTSPLLAGAPS